MRVNAVLLPILLSKGAKVGAFATAFFLVFHSLSPAVKAQQPTDIKPNNPPVLGQDNPSNTTPSNITPASGNSTDTNPSNIKPDSGNVNNITPSNSLPSVTTDPNTNVTSGETEYTVGAGDRLRIDIFQVKDYSGEYPVLVDGTLNLPLIGKIPAEGMSLGDLSEQISQKYAVYLRRPIITVGLVEARPLKVAIAGEVNSPGSYTVSFNEQSRKFPSVTDLIERSGGLTTAANIRQVQVRRNFKGRDQIVNVNLWDLLDKGAQSQNITLRDGDSIFVPATDKISTIETLRLADASFGIKTNKPITVAIVGEVNRPGSYVVKPEELTDVSRVQGEPKRSLPPRLTRALGVAGGIKPLANVRNVEVRRLARDGTERKLAVNLWNLLQSGSINEDVILQDGDTIIIPKADKLDPKEADSLATASFSPGTIKVNVVGEVKKPGAVDVPPNTPLNQALLAAGGFDSQRAERGSVELVRLNPDGTVNKRQIKVNFSENLDETNNPPLRNNDVIVVKRSGFTGVTDTLGALFNPVGAGINIFRSILGF